MSSGPLSIAQAPASLLGDREKAPTPPPPDAQGAPAGGLDPAGPRPAYDEAWFRKAVVLACNGLAEEFGPEMRATELELALLVPVLYALAQQHAPAFIAGQAQDANLVVLGGVLLFMGARRGMAIRRRRRKEGPAGIPRPRASAPSPASPPTAPPPPAGSVESNGAMGSPGSPSSGAFGSRPVVLGGRLGDGRRL